MVEVDGGMTGSVLVGCWRRPPRCDQHDVVHLYHILMIEYQYYYYYNYYYLISTRSSRHRPSVGHRSPRVLAATSMIVRGLAGSCGVDGC